MEVRCRMITGGGRGESGTKTSKLPGTPKKLKINNVTKIDQKVL